MIVDAIVLAGGRSSRLGTDKAALVLGSRTLLGHALEAAASARRRIVVGEQPVGALPADVVRVREHPPFGGPAAAVAAGLDALPPDADAVLVLACDMPRAALAVPTLRRRLERTAEADGAIAVDGGRPQHLAALYRVGALLAQRARHPTLDGMPMRTLVAPLRLLPVPVPAGATGDIDTWDAATAFGVHRPHEGGSR